MEFRRAVELVRLVLTQIPFLALMTPNRLDASLSLGTGNQTPDSSLYLQPSASEGHALSC